VLSPQFSPQHLRCYTELRRFALFIRRWTGLNISPWVASPSKFQPSQTPLTPSPHLLT